MLVSFGRHIKRHPIEADSDCNVQVDITPYVGTIVTVVIAFGAFYGAINSRLSRTEQKLDDLKDQVEKHNQVIERTYRLESDMATAYKRIDELKDKDIRIEQKIDSITVGGSE